MQSYRYARYAVEGLLSQCTSDMSRKRIILLCLSSPATWVVHVYCRGQSESIRDVFGAAFGILCINMAIWFVWHGMAFQYIFRKPNSPWLFPSGIIYAFLEETNCEGVTLLLFNSEHITWLGDSQSLTTDMCAPFSTSALDTEEASLYNKYSYDCCTHINISRKTERKTAYFSACTVFHVKMLL